MQEAVWPEGLQETLLPEQSFAEAYAALQDVQRAYLKQCICQIFAWYGSSQALKQRERLHWEQGFCSLGSKRPWPWAVLLLQPGMRAPAPLLAAVLPAMLAQVGEVIVLQSSEQASWPYPQLCALELAGVELAGAASAALQEELLQGLEKLNGPGLILHLGHGSQGLVQEQGLGGRSLRLGLSVPLKAGIWQEPGVQWDFQALRTAHPDLELQSCAPGTNLEIAGAEQAETFFRQDWELLFAPGHLQEQAVQQAGLVLGPGQESCWIWPALQTSLFQSRCLALSSC
ncbi:MAG: hypothetical protein ACLFMQ_05945 [Desulfohalobiaceae bacterium]